MRNLIGRSSTDLNLIGVEPGYTVTRINADSKRARLRIVCDSLLKRSRGSAQELILICIPLNARNPLHGYEVGIITGGENAIYRAIALTLVVVTIGPSRLLAV